MIETKTEPAAPAEASAHPLELNAEEMRSLVKAALDRIVPHIESLPTQAVSDTRGGFELARSLVEAMPEEAAPLSDLLDLIFERAVRPTFNTASPGYLAYIPGGGLFHAAVADLIADSINRYTSIFTPAPALAQLEANVVAWFCRIAGYPPEARGTLTSGGSLANWTALVTARRERLPDDFLKGVIYASDQVHYSMAKGAILAGFPEANVREVPSDDRFRLRPDALAALIEEDRRRGLTPFLIAASAGTTNTGAVDPLPELADLAERHGLWLHVDAAYGGFFLLTEEGRRVMRGIERADSIVLDPHKGLFLPYGTGAVLVRDGQALKRAHSLTADYMPGMQDDPDRVDFSQYSPELSRPFRGLRVWLPFKMHGAGAFRAELEEKLALAHLAADRLRAMEGIEILAEPELSLLAFRLAPAGVPEEELDGLNRRFIERVNARQRVFLTGTKLRGRFALRICVLSFRTHRDRMEQALEDIEAARREVLGIPHLPGPPLPKGEEDSFVSDSGVCT
ncbi:MAG TPA: aminotransferase class I/II-fold pyridoxal phosphate-dependent enzyme [Thermoanaerobaculia bacterium]|jgi:aromatic-L-amino-acid decarboxylase|nr:aminotransferase class I/II-fold pyridoxal phosphate-dependent enzyme [Thermoanaerobaculia bacterium]